VQGNDSIKYATSILDYVFRELAVSYQSRFDLAHVDPSETGFDALGKGVEEGKQAPASQYVSKGLTRSRTDKLGVVSGGSPSPAGGGSASEVSRGGVTNITAIGSAATALKQEPEQKLSPAQALENLAWQKTQTQADAKVEAKALATERRLEAKARGYEGEMCGECGNFTLVRNGPCMKCDTCGSTTGCS
jgi:ribonucleoside-diphosphate reductase alpha chain